ncbi:integrase [Paraburkholderia sp. DD10]|uniref:integrase n=1 Tax=Paraburkholderia sp. DD10 TaxID=3409691 RepID=UPI003B9E799E
MGSIQLRDDNRGAAMYQARIRIKGFPTLSRTFLTRAEAEAWVHEQEGLMRARRHAAKKEAERLRIATECAPEYHTLGDLMRRYLSAVTPHKRSAAQETLRLKGLLKHEIADCPLIGLNPQRVAEWRDARLQTVSGSTVKRDMTVLAHVLKIATDEWGESFAQNPFRLVRRPKESSPRNRRLNAGEEPALLAACDEARAPYLRPVVELALETAMRQSEIVGLEWENINLAGRAALLPMTKNGTSRGVPLSSRAIEILEGTAASRDIAGNRIGFVFSGVTAEAVKRSFIRAVRRAKLADLRFHDLRHEATSRFFERKLTVPEVARITGHKTWTMLERYTHLQLEDVARRLDGPIDGAINAGAIEHLTDELRRLIERAIRHTPTPPPS